jgi:pimeloyl-ACP methyl ester carboxylesterase
VDGHRHEISSADGTRIGLLTAGSGPDLLLVHGGMNRLERWEPIWDRLTQWRRVTAMDRRGRGPKSQESGIRPHIVDLRISPQHAR